MKADTQEIKVLTICGSMQFSEEMMKIAEGLELKDGYAVIQCIYGNGRKYERADVDTLGLIHRRKIDISDAIYVVNINGHIGEATHSEIDYAKKNKKEILYHEPLIV